MTAGALSLPRAIAPAAPPLTGPLRYLYILGAGHSGSTLLAMVLGRHPQICTIGEVKALRIGPDAGYHCSCGQPLAACPFWRAMLREIQARVGTAGIAEGATDIRNVPSPYGRLLLRPLQRRRTLEWLRDAALCVSPAWRRHLRQVRSLTVTLARAACAVSGKDAFVDSSKNGLQLKYLLEEPALDVRVVRLVRDGRGVSASYRTADGISLAQAAHVWRRSQEESEAIVAALPRDRWMDLRYEQFCAEPDATLSAVYGFLGVDRNAPAVPSATTEQHVLGNDRMRMRPIHIRLDERWRSILTPADLRVFEEVAGAMNHRLGYRG
jgi:hypothetical protein